MGSSLVPQLHTSEGVTEERIVFPGPDIEIPLQHRKNCGPSAQGVGVVIERVVYLETLLT